MALKIKEIWGQAETEDGVEWRRCVVISMFKASMSRSYEGEVISSEQMFVLAYYPETGECVELPYNQLIIKTLEDEKTGELTHFSAPEKDEAE